MKITPTFLITLSILILFFISKFLFLNDKTVAQPPDPLPSWNEGDTKQSILKFVENVTKEGTSDYLPKDQRIAVFDNDGTLWTEKPMYVQLYFAADRIKALAPMHPEWKDQEPFASLLKGDMKSVIAGGQKAILEIIMKSHAGMTTMEFESIVNSWIDTARHPQTRRLFTDMTYQPMLELLAFLRMKDFKTFIVTGGGSEFIRPWSERIYGIAREQVIGSTIKTKFELNDSVPVLIRLPEISFINDKGGKPVGINTFIGQHPATAAGNSDGDIQMLQWTSKNTGLRLSLLIHHTDAQREYAYNTGAEEVLEQAGTNSWIVVDMKNDWKVVYTDN